MSAEVTARSCGGGNAATAERVRGGSCSVLHSPGRANRSGPAAGARAHGGGMQSRLKQVVAVGYRVELAFSTPTTLTHANGSIPMKQQITPPQVRRRHSVFRRGHIRGPRVVSRERPEPSGPGPDVRNRPTESVFRPELCSESAGSAPHQLLDGMDARRTPRQRSWTPTVPMENTWSDSVADAALISRTRAVGCSRTPGSGASHWRGDGTLSRA